MKKIILLPIIAVTCSYTFADNLAPKRTETGEIKVEKDYRLEADVGYLINTSKSEGSSSTTKENLAANILFQRQQGIWGQELRAEAVSTNDDSSDDNVERYLLSGKLLHRSSDSVYQFGKLTAEKDLSSAFDYQLTTTVGLGKDVIKTDRKSLAVEVGAGYRYSKERYAPKDDIGEAIATIATFYQYQINQMVRFNQDLSYEAGSDTQTLRSRSALSADLSQSFAATASYNLKDLRSDSGDSRDSLVSLGLRYKY